MFYNSFCFFYKKLTVCSGDVMNHKRQAWSIIRGAGSSAFPYVTSPTTIQRQEELLGESVNQVSKVVACLTDGKATMRKMQAQLMASSTQRPQQHFRHLLAIVFCMA